MNVSPVTIAISLRDYVIHKYLFDKVYAGR